jgi:DNA-binding transcriptional regulator YiaG
VNGKPVTIPKFTRGNAPRFTRGGANTSTQTQTEDHQVVGAALAAARQRAKLTQVELARRLGKPQSLVSAFEGGLRRVDVIEFSLIARTLGADPVDIFAEIVNSWSR